MGVERGSGTGSEGDEAPDASTGGPLALVAEPEAGLVGLTAWRALARLLRRREQDALDLAVADAIDAVTAL